MKIPINTKDLKTIKENLKKFDFEIKSNVPFCINKCPQTNIRVLTFVYNGFNSLPRKIEATKTFKEFIKGFIVQEAQIYLN
jgi:hypothetical protein